MTVLGKILVFVNLLFSLIVGGLVVMVYVARTNYAVELNRSRDQLTAAQASRDQAFQRAERVQTEYDTFIRKVQGDMQALDAQVRAKQAEAELLAAQLAEEKKKVAKFDAINQGAQSDVTRRQNDVERMRGLLKNEMDKNIALVKENNTLRETATAAEIQFKAVNERNARMEAQLQELARDMAKMRANNLATASTSALASSRAVKNPPVESIEGQVKIADPSGLVKISIGSDAGLTKGHTLEVFRLSPIPTQSKYLGTIRILEVSSNEAVGQPISKMSAPLVPGDRVASRILGS